MQDAFAAHISKRIQNTKVAIEYNQDDYKLPAVLVDYIEKDNINAGVGHEEWLPSPYDPDSTNPTTFIKYYHRLYHGQLKYEVYAQSSTDMMLIRDAVAEILATTDATPWGNAFVQRLYFYMNQTPYGYFNFPFLSTDRLIPIGKTTKQLPWAPEDKAAYCSGYMMDINGYLYSATPNVNSNYGGTSLIEEVDLTVTELYQLNDPTTIASTDFYEFNGTNSNTESI